MTVTDNWEFTAGEDVTRVYEWYESDGTTPADLTGRTYTSQLRAPATSDTSYAFTCTVSIVASTVTLTMADTLSETIRPGTYAWDLRQDDGGTVTVPVRGYVTVNPAVTR